LLPALKGAAPAPRATTARIGEFDTCATLVDIVAEYLAGRENVQAGVGVPPGAGRGTETTGMPVQLFIDPALIVLRWG
jgi:hypothetical protein